MMRLGHAEIRALVIADAEVLVRVDFFQELIAWRETLSVRFRRASKLAASEISNLIIVTWIGRLSMNSSLAAEI